MKPRYFSWMGALIAALSGFCCIVYLVVWDRTAKYHFGGDAIPSTIIAAACLLGLGAGAGLFSRCRKNPFKALALIQLVSGLYGLLGFHVISSVAGPLMRLLATGPDATAAAQAAAALGSLLLLLPPSALIGGVLPLLFRCGAGYLGISAGILGASLGAAALPLLLLNSLSLPATSSVAGSINLILALLVLLWSRSPVDTGMLQVEADVRLKPFLSGLAFVCGFIMTGFAVSLLRALPIVNPSSAYNFPLGSALFLLALALGSAFSARAAAASRDAILYRIGWLMSSAMLGMLLGIWIASRLQAQMYPISLLPLLDGDYAGLPWVLLFLVTLIMPSPLLFGAVLPLLLRLHASAKADLADSAGRLSLSLLLGGCSALVLGRFAGFPLLGTPLFLTLLYALGCAAGIAIMARVWRRNGGGFSGALPAGLAALSLMLAVMMPSGIWLTYITGGPERNWEVLEGPSGIAQLWWEEEHADLRVNGEYMSRLPYHPRHVNQEVFLLAQPRREKVLMLGMGGAEIIRSLAEDAGVHSIDVVDRSYELPAILSGGRAADMLNHALASPKVRILTADARVAVGRYEDATFDVVFDNLAFAWWAGSTAVKSEAYFREIRRILKPEGVFLSGANYQGRNRLAVLAGLVTTFEMVREHRQAPIVIAMSREPQYFDFRIIQLAEPRAAIFGLNYTGLDALPAWFRNEFIPVGSGQLEGVAPVRDDLLIYEYFWRGF